MAEPRSSARVWLAYSLLRLACFGIPLLIVWGFSRNLQVSAVLAAVIGLALSVVLLEPQRGALAVRLQRRADQRRPSSDEAIEDEAGERRQGSASAAESPRP